MYDTSNSVAALGQDQTYRDMAHLIRRTAFGAAPDELRQMALRGIPAVTAELLDFDHAPDTINDDVFLRSSVAVDAGEIGGIRIRDLDLHRDNIRTWWLYRMLRTPNPLQEKMVLFWHNHFTSSDDDDYSSPLMRQNKLFRTHALGNFRELTQAVSRDGEMLRYLNGNQNYKAHPNENYGRELMELFTVGRVGPDGKSNYTEDDVKAAARAFTGWNMNGEFFSFNAAEHDNGTKQFMGREGNFDGSDIVDMLVALPNTGWYMCRKLFRYFAYYDPEPAVLQPIVDTYFSSGYDIKAVVTKILTSDAFYSDKARDAVIKAPVDVVIGTIKMAGMAPFYAPEVSPISPGDDPGDPDKLDPDDVRVEAGKPDFKLAQSVLNGLHPLGGWMRAMGQDLLNPPNVKGWDGGEQWININTIQARARFALYFATLNELRIALPQVDHNANSVIYTVECDAHPEAGDPSRLLDSLLLQFGPLKISDTGRAAILSYANGLLTPGERVRSVLALILATNEFQVA